MHPRWAMKHCCRIRGSVDHQWRGAAVKQPSGQTTGIDCAIAPNRCEKVNKPLRKSLIPPFLCLPSARCILCTIVVIGRRSGCPAIHIARKAEDH